MMTFVMTAQVFLMGETSKDKVTRKKNVLEVCAEAKSYCLYLVSLIS